LLYTGGEFSITIRNKRNEFVLYSPVGYGFDPAAVSASVVKNDFTGDGVTVAFVLSASPSTVLATNIFINGVYQEKDSYTLSGNTITFSIAPPLSSSIEILTNETGVINSGNANDISYTLTAPGATLQSVQTKLEQYVSVKDFGAVGDGVTDDTAAIQAAATNSGAVYFPEGSYLIDTAISVPSNTYLYAESATVTQSTAGGAHAFTIAGNNVTIDGLTIVGPNSGSGSAVFALNRNNPVVKNCKVQNWLYGLQLRGCKNWIVQDNRIWGGTYDSVAASERRQRNRHIQ
jgi:polygalacturonase